MERVAGIEPAPSAWKAEVLPLNYTRNGFTTFVVLSQQCFVVELQYQGLIKNGGGGRIRTFEALATDLQSVPFDRSGTPPNLTFKFTLNTLRMVPAAGIELATY